MSNPNLKQPSAFIQDDVEHHTLDSSDSEYDSEGDAVTKTMDDEAAAMPLMERLEPPAHHAAHWIMLWSQSHYLGQAAASAMSAGAGVSKELLVVIFGIIFIALGIIASGFVVVSEFRTLREVIGIEKGGKSMAVQRRCMVLAGSASLVFSALQIFAAVVVPMEETEDCIAVLLFRVTSILWGGVSAFLWYTLSCRRDAHASNQSRRQSTTEIMV